MNSSIWSEQVVLQGNHVTLFPLSIEHLDSLCNVGLDPELWNHNAHPVRTRLDMRKYIESALRSRDTGNALPFAIIDRQNTQICGSTRYGNMDPTNRRLEIGWTWIGKQWQRTAVNTEAKLLLLRYAFEQLECQRVEFKTDVNNAVSRKAIERLGAKQEGVLRSHMIRDDGSFRDTIYFSIIKSEWLSVEQRLQSFLRTR